MMDKKCSKYEGLFIFSDEAALAKHIEECEECRKEQEKMDRVSELIDEVKLYYRSKNAKKRVNLKAVCAVSLLLFSTLTLGVAYNNDDFMDTMRYGDIYRVEGSRFKHFQIIGIDTSCWNFRIMRFRIQQPFLANITDRADHTIFDFTGMDKICGQRPHIAKSYDSYSDAIHGMPPPLSV